MTTTITVPSEAWLQQVNQVVRLVLSQQTSYGSTAPQRQDTYSAIVIVQPTEQIPARAGTLCGSGNCKLKRIDTDGNLEDAYHRDGSSVINETLYNPYIASSIEAGSMVIAGREIASGRLVAISEDCT